MEDSETGESSDTVDQDLDNDPVILDQGDNASTGETVQENESAEDVSDEAMIAEGTVEDEEESNEVTIKKQTKSGNQIPFGDARGMTLGNDISGVVDYNPELDESTWYNCYYFIPEESGVYSFSATIDYNPWVTITAELFDESYNSIASVSSSSTDSGTMASAQMYLNAGMTYYWVLSVDDYGTYTVHAKVEKDDVDFVCNRSGARNRKAHPNEELTLSVTAYSTNSITFQWTVDGEAVEGQNTSSYTFIPESSCIVVCNVLDEDENVLGSVDFDITLDNELSATTEDGDEYTSINAEPDSTHTLRVIVNAVDRDGITYEWYKDNTIIDGANTDSLTIIADRSGSYRCDVYDKYGGNAQVYYSVRIPNSIELEVEEEHTTDSGYGEFNSDITIFIKPNEAKIAHVNVTAQDTTGMKYRWCNDYMDVDDVPWIDYSGETLTYTFDADRDWIYLWVEDRFGNRVISRLSYKIENHFGLTIEGTGHYRDYYTVHPGESVDLRAVAEGDDLTNMSILWKQYVNPDNNFEEYQSQKFFNDIKDLHMTVTPTTPREWYALSVSDGYGNSQSVSFYITVDNGLKAYPDGNDEDDNTADISISPTGEAVLKTNVSVYDDENLQYQWDKDGLKLEGETSPQLSYPVTQKGTYSCVVKDNYGYSSCAYFNITVDNQFTVRHEGDGDYVIGRKTVYTDPGEPVELHTEASVLAGTLTYEWYKDGELISDADSDRYQASGDKTATYRCNVSDEYGNSGYVEFRVVINAGLTAYAEGTANQRIRHIDEEPAVGTILKVIAESDSTEELQYAWYRGSSNSFSTELIERQTSDSYSITDSDVCRMSENDRYICVVTDIYGNHKTVEFIFDITSIFFNVYPENAPDNGVNVLTYADSITGKAVLKTIVETNDTGISYQWYLGPYLDEELPGETGDTLEVTITKPTSYVCKVTNSAGINKYANFDVSTHQFFVHTAESAEYYERYEVVRLDLQPGEEYTLKPIVEADETCEISYEWRKDDSVIADAAGQDSLTVAPEKFEQYSCKVSDQYGNYCNVIYNIYVGELNVTFDGVNELEGADEWHRYTIIKQPNEPKDITCHVESIPGDEISISWTGYDYSRDIAENLGSGASITLTSDDYNEVECSIRSKYLQGTSKYLNVKNNYLSLSPLSSKVVTLYGQKWGYESVQAGQSINLQTELDSADYTMPTYSWYELLYNDTTNSSFETYTLSGNNSSRVVCPDADTDYLCVVKDQYGNESSAYFHVSTTKEGEAEEITILQHPQSAEILPGEQVTMSVMAEGDDLSYQWQWSSDGENWNNCAGSGYNTDTFAFTMKALYNGRRYRCAVSRGDETAYTNAATATMKALEITRNPADAEAQPGEQVTMTVEAEGGNVAYQWQWSSDGETWKNCTSGGYNTDTFAFVMKAAYNGRQYRCKVTRDSETVYSTVATATLKALGIIRNPEDAEASIGEQVTMTVEAEGGNLTYQWQWSNDGETWNNCFAEGYNTDTFAFTMKAAYDGRQYRCKVTRDSETVYSTAAMASLKALSIIHNPEDASVLEGEEVRMTVEAEGGDLSYQWQWSSNGETWNNCLAEGYNTDTFVFTMKAAYDGRQYRCAVTRGSETEYSQPGTASLKPLEFTLQPADTEAAAGEQVILTVEAEGENLSYQWQWSSDGETWKNCMGASYNTSAFTFTMKALYSGRQYRCIVTRGTQKGYSDAATVTITQ